MNASLFINFFKLLFEKDTVLFGLLLVCLLINIICVIMAAILTLLIIINTSNDKLKKNPLNKETVAYEIQEACNILYITSKYPYGVIIWLMSINILLVIYALIRVFSSTESKPEAATVENKSSLGNRLTLILVVIVFTIITAFVFGICLYFFLNAKLQINIVNANIVDFNGYIIQNIYKTADILVPLQNVPTNSLQIMHNIEESIINYLDSHDKKYFKDENNYKTITNDLGKLFFTFDLYHHYNDMGLNNPNLHSALKNIFNLTNIFKYTIYNNIKINQTGSDVAANDTEQNATIFKDTVNGSWPATDNLIKKYTFIKDYSNQYIELVQSSVSKENNINGNIIPGECLLNAANIAANVCVNASQKANNFDLESSLSSFMTMSTFILIATALPFIIIWLLLMTDMGAKFQTSVIKDTENNASKNIKTKETEMVEIQNEFTKLKETYNTINATNTTNGGTLEEEQKNKLVEVSNDFISLGKKISDICSIVNESSKIIVNRFNKVKDQTNVQINNNTKESDYKQLELLIPNIRIANTIIGECTKLINDIYELLKNIQNLIKDNETVTNNLSTFSRSLKQFNEQKLNVENTYEILIKEKSTNIPLVSENQNK